MNYINNITKTIQKEIKKWDLYILGQDIRKWGWQWGFLLSLVDKYSDKIIDTPIAESATSGIATWLALGGKRVFVEYAFFDFILHSADQIINNSIKLQFFAEKKHKINLPIVYYATLNSWRGYGATHSQSLEYIFSNLDNINVIYPSNSIDARDLLEESLNSNTPTLFINHKLLHAKENNYNSIKDGKARVIQKGKKTNIISYGRPVQMIQEVIENNNLKDIGLIDLRYLSKIDYKTIVENIKNNKVLFIEEGFWIIMKQLISDLIINYNLDGKNFNILCSKKSAIATNYFLEDDVLITKSKIEKEIKKLLKV